MLQQKKMRLYISGYYQAEYIYMLSKNGLVMNHKEYSVAKVKNKLKKNEIKKKKKKSKKNKRFWDKATIRK